MKKAIFTMSYKGGTGRSTFARAFLEHLRTFAPNLNVVAVDGHPKIGHLSKFYGLKDDAGKYSARLNKANPCKGVLEIDASVPKNLIDLVNLLAALEPDVLLVDLPSGVVESLAEAVGDIKGLKQTYREYGYELILALGINPSKASASSIHDVLNVWGEEGVGYVGVLNLGSARRGDFAFYDGDPAERLRSAGGKEFLLHELHADSYSLWEASERSFREAADAAPPGHRIRLLNWRDRIDAEIYKLGLLDYSTEQAAEFEKNLKEAA